MNSKHSWPNFRFVKEQLFLAGATGLRRSELFGLKWSDLNFLTMEVGINRSCVRNHFGAVKTEASGKPVPLSHTVKDALVKWRKLSEYGAEDDFLFPSVRLNGKFPLSPDSVLKKIIRPALVRAGITGEDDWLAFVQAQLGDEPTFTWGRCKNSLKNCFDTQTRE